MHAHRFLTAAVAAATLTIAGVGVAAADNVVPDADNVNAGVQATLDLGTIACGDSTTVTVPVWLTRSGGTSSPQVWGNGAVLAISATDPSALVGVTLGLGSVTLPSDWTALSSGSTHYFESTSVASVDAGAEGPHSVAIDYSASGAGASAATVTRTAQISLAWTTGPCGPVNTPPTVEVTGVADSATYSYGSVPDAACSVSDAEDTGESATPVLTGPGVATGIGEITATCSYTDGGGLPDTASATYTVTRATTTVVVTCPTSVEYDGSAQTPCTAGVTGAGGLSAGLAVSYLANTNVGPASASASFAGDTHYLPSDDTETFAITPAGSTVTVSCPSSVGYDGSAQTPCTASATGVGGLNVDLTGSVTYSANVDAGEVTASASYAGDANHTGDSDSATFTITKAPTVVSIDCGTGPHTYAAVPLTPCTATATRAGGLSESLTVTYGDNTDAGTATAAADYAGSTNYEPGHADSTFTIDPAQVTVTVTCGTGPFTYDGSAHEPCTAVATGPGLDQSLTVVYSNNVNAGSASGSASFATGGNYLGSSDTEDFTIDKADSLTTVTCAGDVVYDGNPQTPCAASATGAGGLNEAVAVGYAPGNVNAGPVTASASYPGDANHEASSGSAGFEILKAPSTVTVTCPTTPLQPTGLPQTPCTAEANGVALPGPLPLSVSYLNNTAGGTATASASWPGDLNHLASSGQATFTIVTWGRSGFYQPVDMSGIYNTVKGGSTVPLKFEVFDGTTELTAVTVVKSFMQQQVSCPGSIQTDEVEVTSTGGTTLRYDAVGGQFIQNWQSPKTPGACYKVTMTTLDLQSIIAWFKLK